VALSLDITHNSLDDIRNFCRNFLFLSLIVSWTWWHSLLIIYLWFIFASDKLCIETRTHNGAFSSVNILLHCFCIHVLIFYKWIFKFKLISKYYFIQANAMLLWKMAHCTNYHRQYNARRVLCRRLSASLLRLFIEPLISCSRLRKAPPSRSRQKHTRGWVLSWTWNIDSNTAPIVTWFLQGKKVRNLV